MTTCPTCSNVNKPGERFCTRCGKPLAASSQGNIPPTQVSPMLRGAAKGKTQVMSPQGSNTQQDLHIHKHTEIVGTKSSASPAPRTGGGKNKTQIFNPNKINVKPAVQAVQTNNMIPNKGDSPLVGFLICKDFNGDTNGVFWPLRSGRTYIGRDSSEAQIVLPFDNISSAHAVIIFRPNGKNWIADNNSQNGTLVNGEDIGPDKVALENGSRIQIGDICLDVLLYENKLFA